MSIEEMREALEEDARRIAELFAQVKRLERSQRGRDSRAKQPAKRKTCLVCSKRVAPPQIRYCSATCREKWR